MTEDSKKFMSDTEGKLWLQVHASVCARYGGSGYAIEEADKSVAAWRERNTGGFDPKDAGTQTEEPQ